MEFNEITIESKSLFDRYMRMYNPQASELTFTNLFMWRNFYKTRYAEVNGFLCIVSAPDDGEPFAFMPIGQREGEGFVETVKALQSYFERRCWVLKFKRVVESELECFKDLTAKGEDVDFEMDNSDYVYMTSELTGLKGKKYDGKRNHINKFKKLYEYEYVVLEEKYIDECMRIMEEWCLEKKCAHGNNGYCEKLANIELLANYASLECKGAIVKVNGRFEGFTAGEMLNGDTAVIHIEKAKSSINGLYTFINQQFCEHEWQEAEYVNREQDLGEEGIRRAKLSYHPVKMVKKYSITIV